MNKVLSIINGRVVIEDTATKEIQEVLPEVIPVCGETGGYIDRMNAVHAFRSGRITLNADGYWYDVRE